jgi:hypothetical protein
MRDRTRLRVLALVTAGALAATGPAWADATYPPAPPAGTELPTEAVNPDVVERTSPPAADVEVLPSVVERLPVTGAALVGLLGLSAALLAGGLLSLVGARRRSRRDRS